MNFLDLKNPFNEARKARRLAQIERNLEKAKSSSSASKKRDGNKEQIIDLSKKDNKSGRGRYV